jgi:hypothetical protein
VAVLAKLSGARIKLEVAKALGPGRLRGIRHDPPRFARSLAPQVLQADCFPHDSWAGILVC